MDSSGNSVLWHKTELHETLFQRHLPPPILSAHLRSGSELHKYRTLNPFPVKKKTKESGGRKPPKWIMTTTEMRRGSSPVDFTVWLRSFLSFPPTHCGCRHHLESSPRGLKNTQAAQHHLFWPPSQPANDVGVAFKPPFSSELQGLVARGYG